jgi:hypothetical protein
MPQDQEHPRPRRCETSVQDSVLPSLHSLVLSQVEYAVLHWKPTIIPGCVEDRPNFLPLARCIKIEPFDDEDGTAHIESDVRYGTVSSSPQLLRRSVPFSRIPAVIHHPQTSDKNTEVVSVAPYTHDVSLRDRPRVLRAWNLVSNEASGYPSYSNTEVACQLRLRIRKQVMRGNALEMLLVRLSNILNGGVEALG